MDTLVLLGMRREMITSNLFTLGVVINMRQVLGPRYGCYGCGERGHMMKYCPEAKTNVKRARKLLLIKWNMVLLREIGSMLSIPRVIKADFFTSLSGMCFFNGLYMIMNFFAIVTALSNDKLMFRETCKAYSQVGVRSLFMRSLYD